jgi:hypothetical protein
MAGQPFDGVRLVGDDREILEVLFVVPAPGDEDQLGFDRQWQRENDEMELDIPLARLGGLEPEDRCAGLFDLLDRPVFRRSGP